MEKRAGKEQAGLGPTCKECEIRLLSQGAQREQFMRHLYITLNNTILLLENVRPYVPNLLEWDNMLDHYYGILNESKRVIKSQKSYAQPD